MTAMTATTGLDPESLAFTLESIDEFAQRELSDALLIELDERDEFPEELVRSMCGEELGRPVAVRARASTAAWAAARSTSTGSASAWPRSTSASPPRCSPPSSAATRSGSAARPSSEALWLGRIAEEGILMAYGATEPDAGRTSPR